MSQWVNNPKWCFSDLGNGDKVGVNNAGIGQFKKNPYIGLTKEILQNVIDAKDPNSKKPVRASFEIIEIAHEDLPDPERLSDVIKKCYEYYHNGDDGIKMSILNEAAIKFLDSGLPVPVLKISDFNTTGLTGVHEEKESNWTGLVREVGSTNKGNGKSGSFGVGKFAPFNFSSIRTILYSTKNIDNEVAFQGKTILTTFKDSDGILKQNVGLFGYEDTVHVDCKAIYDFAELPEIYKRNEIGTDLFVLGVKADPDWAMQTTISVIDSFFYAIHKNEIEVSIKDGETNIIIDGPHLPELMIKAQNYCEEHDIVFSAPVFWDVIQDESGQTKKFVTNIKEKGEIELHLKVDPDFYDRRILEMRKAGMRIQEDTAFRIGSYFHGVLIATGKGSKSDKPEDNINSFLRKCENHAHTSWSKDEYDEHEDEADKILKDIHAWILECVKSLMPKQDSSETDAYGLSDLLPNQFSTGGEDQQEDAFLTFEPLPLEVAALRIRTGYKKISDISVVAAAKGKDEDKTIVLTDGDEDVLGGERTNPEPNPDPGPHPGPYPGPFPGPFPGPNPTDEPLPIIDGSVQTKGQLKDSKESEKNSPKQLHSIAISNIKTPYNFNEDTYVISFIPLKDAQDVFLRIRIGSDDDDRKMADILEAVAESTLEIEKGYIKIPRFIKGNKVRLCIKLRNKKRIPLEVTAYAK